MISCLKCNAPLILNIDAKNNDFSCKNCAEKYNMLFDKKMLKISRKNKHLNFFIHDLSNCDEGFSLKNVYEMYNKGYLDCVKTLNSKYNQSDNYWQLSIAKLKDKISHGINSKINSIINSGDEMYLCDKCMSQYSSQDALVNNYSCIMCSGQLILKDKMDDVEELKKNLLSVEGSWSTSF